MVKSCVCLAALNHTVVQVQGCLTLSVQWTYRIAGKFGEEFNLANWRGILKNAKLKIANFEIYTLNGMRLRIFVSRESTSAGIRQI